MCNVNLKQSDSDVVVESWHSSPEDIKIKIIVNVEMFDFQAGTSLDEMSL